jgi:epoxyqueuosine reductase
VRFQARIETDNPPLSELLGLDDAAFRARFAGTPVKRTGRNRFVRNCLIAAGNSGDATLLPRVEALLADGSPLVRAMAVWALARLADASRLAAMASTHAPRERDADVSGEWRQAAG